MSSSVYSDADEGAADAAAGGAGGGAGGGAAGLPPRPGGGARGSSFAGKLRALEVRPRSCAALIA